MSSDRYAYQYVYPDGRVADAPLPDLREAVKSYHEENDGWSFLNRGAEGRLVVSLGYGATLEGIRALLQLDPPMRLRVKEALQKMVDTGKLEHTVQFPDDD